MRAACRQYMLRFGLPVKRLPHICAVRDYQTNVCVCICLCFQCETRTRDSGSRFTCFSAGIDWCLLVEMNGTRACNKDLPDARSCARV